MSSQRAFFFFSVFVFTSPALSQRVSNNFGKQSISTLWFPAAPHETHDSRVCRYTWGCRYAAASVRLWEPFHIRHCHRRAVENRPSMRRVIFFFFLALCAFFVIRWNSVNNEPDTPDWPLTTGFNSPTRLGKSQWKMLDGGDDWMNWMDWMTGWTSKCASPIFLCHMSQLATARGFLLARVRHLLHVSFMPRGVERNSS